MNVKGVKCDEDGCGWRKDGVDIKEWLKVPCPKCGKGEIITEEEMRLLEVFRGLEMIGKALFPGPTANVELDIGPMRKGEAPKILKVNKNS